MKKILTIIGTRPEAIKVIMLHKLLMNNDLFEPSLLCTGQHQELVTEVLQIFDVKPDVLYTIPKEVDSLNSKSSFLLAELEKEINLLKPDFIIVQGDTLSSFCGALSAHFLRVPLIHVEAGLRSGNKWGPFPEEMLRRSIDLLSDYLMAPTSSAVNNLINEGFSSEQILLTGNTGIDTLSYVAEKIRSNALLPSKSVIDLVDLKRNNKTALLTLHRRESQLDFVEKYLLPVDKAAEELGLKIWFCLHPNPILESQLVDVKFQNIEIIPSLNYIDFFYMMQSCALILTDSGGIQEEAVFLGKPLIVLRKETERTEALANGFNQMIDLDNLSNQISALLSKGPRPSNNLYGDGKASQKILGFLEAL